MTGVKRTAPYKCQCHEDKVNLRNVTQHEQVATYEYSHIGIGEDASAFLRRQHSRSHGSTIWDKPQTCFGPLVM